MKSNGKLPLYSQIQLNMSEKITSGEWPAHYQIPSEKEIGEQFGVSRITAKNAVMGLVNEGLLYRHRGKGTFVAERKRAEITEIVEPEPEKKKKIIGFMFHWMEVHYGAQLFAGVETALNELGYLVIYKRVASFENESQALRELLDVPVSGLIVFANSEEHFNDDIIRLALNKYPLVLVEKTMRDIRTNSVYCDTERAGALMAEYLLNKGLREIGLITYPSSFTYGVKERIFGFQAGLVNGGVKPLSEDGILTLRPNDLIMPGWAQPRETVPDSIVEFIKQRPQLNAIATVDALLARFVSLACAQLNRRDVTIVCCDEPSGYYGGIVPAAYVDQSPQELGRRSAKLLIDCIEQAAEPQTIKVDPKIIEI
ncbi:GntR family transcriptional regulator [Cohnella fermenti]|uniref:GntR family transcriptional regulator n=1 Tax=Cohnella fermenti TaxID=2565925 RepID=A0A4S4BTG9_9BACL|nr:GntR family transcriptional regulator [Cohnella fermenti]THF77795.1 GntR family transcriptional regulator [Cohnella fermenti]